MAVNPRTVISPQTRLRQMRVVHWSVDWSLAIGLWDNNRALLCRWNGDQAHPMGNPVSSAHPTWFVLPKAFYDPLLTLVPEPNRSSASRWLDGDEPTAWAEPVEPG